MIIRSVDAYLNPPEWCFVRIQTDEGITGWGEAGAQSRHRTVLTAIHEMGEYLVGRDPSTIEDHWQVLTRAGFNRGGPILSSAVAAIDIALWDIAGKSLGAPVHQLLAGPVRERIRAYVWIAGNDMVELTTDQLVLEVKQRMDEGFTAGKMSPPRTEPIARPTAVEEIVARVDALRASYGAAFDIAIDLHGRFSKTMSHRLLPRLEPYQLLFVEEPVPSEYTHLLGELTSISSVPIATGERLYSRWEFRDVVSTGLAVAQPDVSQAGGISETRRIASLAEMYGIQVAPHCPLGPIALAAALQLDFAVPNILIQELSFTHASTFFEYVGNPEVFTLDAGHFRRPLGPGLGINVDEERIVSSAEDRHRSWTIAGHPIWRHPDGSLAEF